MSVDEGTAALFRIRFQTTNPRSSTMRNTISVAISAAGTPRGMGLVCTLSCRKEFRVTPGLARLRGSPFASLCLGRLNILWVKTFPPNARHEISEFPVNKSTTGSS